jgi:predicted membrane chloride channel (bestrophin family)
MPRIESPIDVKTLSPLEKIKLLAWEAHKTTCALYKEELLTLSSQESYEEAAALYFPIKEKIETIEKNIVDIGQRIKSLQIAEQAASAQSWDYLGIRVNKSSKDKTTSIKSLSQVDTSKIVQEVVKDILKYVKTCKLAANGPVPVASALLLKKQTYIAEQLQKVKNTTLTPYEAELLYFILNEHYKEFGALINDERAIESKYLTEQKEVECQYDTEAIKKASAIVQQVQRVGHLQIESKRAFIAYQQAFTDLLLEKGVESQEEADRIAMAPLHILQENKEINDFNLFKKKFDQALDNDLQPYFPKTSPLEEREIESSKRQLSPSDKAIEDFVSTQIMRLDSFWVWNGRQKARELNTALNKFKQNKEAPDLESRLDSTGLKAALSISRFTVFSCCSKRNKPQSLNLFHKTFKF